MTHGTDTMPACPDDTRCAVCGGGPSDAMNPFITHGLRHELWLHLRCLNSPAGRAWRAAKRAGDPAYDRRMRLTMLGEEIECPACGRPLAQYPKARGWSSFDWDVACAACHRHRAAPLQPVGAAESAFYALERLEEDFVGSRGLDGIDRRVNELAAAFDHLINVEPCVCGGVFSLAARPRCPGCDAIVIDSPFHLVADRTLSRAQSAR